MDGFGDCASCAEQIEGKGTADDGGVVFEGVVEELAVFEGEIEDFGEVGRGGDNGGGWDMVGVARNSGLADGKGGDGGDVFELGDGVNVGEGEIGFLVLRTGGEFVDDTIDGIFARVGANDDEVGAGAFDLCRDEASDAAGKGKNENDGSDANGDAEGGEEGTGAVATEAAIGELEVDAN